MLADFPERVVHGGTGKRLQEKTRKNLMDFSASVNPFPPAFSWHCEPGRLAQYPDNEYRALKEKIAKTYNRREEEICVGNGSIEVIRMFCQAVFRTKQTFSLEQPTFGEYDLSARLAGGRLARDPGSADVAFTCNPNNPTGILRKQADLKSQLDLISGSGGILFCDEAFIDLSDPGQSLSSLSDTHLFTLQSFTKSFSVPGIRFGFGFGDPALIEMIETLRPPWSVNAYAEAFALEALDHLRDLRVSRERIAREREWLIEHIGSLGLLAGQSMVNYLLIECGMSASALADRMEQCGVLVRDCTSFGLPSSIRVAVRTRDENRILVENLAACLR